MKRWWLTAFIAAAILLTLKNPFAEKELSPQVSKKIERVVSLAPSMSETMIALNQTHLLVGVTTQCNDPKLKDVPKIGSFAEPNLETILALNPDLVLAVPHVMARPTITQLQAQNIMVFTHQPDMLKDIRFIVTKIGSYLAIEPQAKELNASIDTALQKALRSAQSNSAFSEKKRFLVAISASPLVVAGVQTFASEIIESLGFYNMAQNLSVAWPIWPQELLIQNPPDLFLISDGHEQLASYHQLFSNLGIKKIMHARLMVPKLPIFQSPSPTIIHDLDRFMKLLDAAH